jgi:hypothetical protein
MKGKPLTRIPTHRVFAFPEGHDPERVVSDFFWGRAPMPPNRTATPPRAIPA